MGKAKTMAGPAALSMGNPGRNWAKMDPKGWRVTPFVKQRRKGPHCSAGPVVVIIGFRDGDDWFGYRVEHDGRFLRKVAKAAEEIRPSTNQLPKSLFHSLKYCSKAKNSASLSIFINDVNNLSLLYPSDSHNVHFRLLLKIVT